MSLRFRELRITSRCPYGYHLAITPFLINLNICKYFMVILSV
jgi:hypothetical protein